MGSGRAPSPTADLVLTLLLNHIINRSVPQFPCLSVRGQIGINFLGEFGDSDFQSVGCGHYLELARNAQAGIGGGLLPRCKPTEILGMGVTPPGL